MIKYEQIANELCTAIQSGKFRSGEQLPLEKEMCEHYGVSRITVKRAVDELVKMGLVVKRRGSGTFVKSLDCHEVKDLSVPDQFLGFAATFKNKNVHTKLLRFDIVHPSAEVASKLQVPEDDFVYDIIRVRYMGDEPMVVEYTMMPIAVIPGLKKEHLLNSIYSYIETDLGLKIQSAHRAIRALMPTDEEKKELAITGIMPVQEISQVAFLADGRPFEYSIAHHRADKNTFRTVSVR